MIRTDRGTTRFHSAEVRSLEFAVWVSGALVVLFLLAGL